MRAKTILILGGTRQALDLADLLNRNRNYSIITSLAGRTRSPAKPAGDVRTGGFGGIQALAAYLVAKTIDYLVDATHPFAATISQNAAHAARLANIPRILLRRPPWQPGPGDHWEYFPDLHAAAAGIKPKARCFLTIGRQELAAFKARADVWFLVRMIEAPEKPLPLDTCEVITGMPLRSASDEKSLMLSHGIDTLITKNSGGSLSAAKLDAARKLGLRVMMIKRPAIPEGDVMETVEAVVKWLRDN